MKYVIDIDGTICEHLDRPNFGKGKVYHDRIARINELYNQGHEIVYYTARGMGEFNQDNVSANNKWYKYTYDQLIKWNCKFTQLLIGKYSGDVYIDDKAINSEDFFRNN